MLQEYDREGTRAAILFIAQRAAEPTFHKVGKLLYLADLEHLKEYGRLMFGDIYKAAEWGPLPSNAHNDMTAVREHRVSAEAEGYRVAMQAVRGSKKLAPVIQPIGELDEDALSYFAVQCLTKATEMYGGWDFDQLCKLTHDSMWEALREGRTQEAPVISMYQLAEKVLGAEAGILIEHLNDPYPGDAKEMGVSA